MQRRMDVFSGEYEANHMRRLEKVAEEVEAWNSPELSGPNPWGAFCWASSEVPARRDSPSAPLFRPMSLVRLFGLATPQCW